MKTTLLSIITLTIAPFLFGQNVNIPDANFKAYLVGETSINTNGDTEIQVSEAQAYTGTINVYNENIADLTGIEAFTSITALDCQFNQLTSMDLSSNTALTQLYCKQNQLSSLDLSNNTALTHLYCQSNQISSLDLSNNTSLYLVDCGANDITSINLNNTNLTELNITSNQVSSIDLSGQTNLEIFSCESNLLTSLDVSNNTNLLNLACGDNDLTTLDVSSNPNLTTLACGLNDITALDLSSNSNLTFIWCSRNSLTELNVANGNNANVTNFDATINPDLACIEVDDATYSTNNWTNIDATASFSENCSLSLEDETTMELTIYPNPARDVMNISSNQEIESALLFDLNGQLIKKTTAKNITVGELNPGVYLVQVTTPKAVVTKRIVKQ